MQCNDTGKSLPSPLHSRHYHSHLPHSVPLLRRRNSFIFVPPLQLVKSMQMHTALADCMAVMEKIVSGGAFRMRIVEMNWFCHM